MNLYQIRFAHSKTNWVLLWEPVLLLILSVLVLATNSTNRRRTDQCIMLLSCLLGLWKMYERYSFQPFFCGYFSSAHAQIKNLIQQVRGHKNENRSTLMTLMFVVLSAGSEEFNLNQTYFILRNELTSEFLWSKPCDLNPEWIIYYQPEVLGPQCCVLFQPAGGKLCMKNAGKSRIFCMHVL